MSKMSQKQAVEELMTLAGNDPYTWWTLPLLKKHLFDRWQIMASEAGISARLRDLRKEGYVVERRLKQGANRLYEYRLS